jgi:hypothetical protein
MNSGGEKAENAKTQSWAPFSFWRWTFLSLASWGVCQAVLIFLAGLALNLSPRSLLLPYLLLLWCGFVGGTLIYWARQSYPRPRAGAIRFTFAIFVSLNLYMGALLFSAYRLRFLSQETALYDNGPYILPGAALASAAVYITARRRLEAISQTSGAV